MRTRLLLLVALGLALPAAAQRRPSPPAPPARPAPAVPPTERGVPFPVGEQLSYDISWSSFVTATAATATVAVREKKPAYGSLAYYVVAEGRPAPVLAVFYSLYYKADAWLDASTLQSLRASVFSQEGARRQNKVTLFDRAHGTAEYQVQAATTTTHQLKLPAGTQDPLSAIYALRAGKLQPGTRTRIPMTFNGNVYQVEVTIGGRESLKTALGTLPVVRMTPVVLEHGRPADSPRGMAIWLSDDARRLPVKMEVELAAGRFDLTLTAVRGGTKPPGR